MAEVVAGIAMPLMGACPQACSDKTASKKEHFKNMDAASMDL
jgi:hypothetical protein